MATYQERIAFSALSQSTLDDLAERFANFEKQYYAQWARDGHNAELGKMIHENLTAMLALKKDLLRGIEDGKVAMDERARDDYIKEQTQSKH